jgi:chromosomal replication initiation ATPase DnaA
VSGTANNARGGEFATARRGGIDALELAFIFEKRGAGVSDFSIANMIGRPVASVRSIPLELMAEEHPTPAPPPPITRRAISKITVRPREQPSRGMPPRVRAIVKEVADRHGLSIKALIGAVKSNRVSSARHEAFALIREIKQGTAPAYSLSMIGSWFGGRHYATVLNGICRHEERVFAEREGMAA